MPFKPFENVKDAQAHNKLQISLQRHAIAFSANFANKLELGDGMGCRVHVDSDLHKLGFEFLPKDVDLKGWFIVGPNGGGHRTTSVGKIINSPSLIRSHAWISAVAELESKSLRTFIASKEGGLWVIQLRPAFETKALRGAKLPTGTGIYRLKLGNTVVYVGRGKVASRVKAAIRARWVFDTVEFSILNNVALEKKSESEWLRRASHSDEKPKYNRYLGQVVQKPRSVNASAKSSQKSSPKIQNGKRGNP